jgi:AcrR family transcriptional regulator
MTRKDPKLERRKELILATISVIGEHGFERTTLARVAKAANASPAEMHHYFHDKKDLLAETLRSLVLKYEGCWREKVNRAAAPIEKLKAMVEADFDPMVTNRPGAIV